MPPGGTGQRSSQQQRAALEVSLCLSARTPYESLLSVFCPFIKDLKRVISGFKFSDSLTDSFPYAFPQKVEKS